MKSAILLLMLVSFSAEAQSLKLMGKGIAKRGTNESIALACVSDECTEVQFVYFNGPGEPQWLGPKIQVPTAPTEELEEKALQTKVAYYMAGNRTMVQEYSKAGKIRNTLSWGVMGGSAAAAMGIGAMTLGTALIVMAPVAVAGVFLRAFPPKSLDSFLVGAGDTVIVSKANDRDGWSWSSHPKNVSEKKFNTLLNALKDQNQYYIFGNGGPVDKIQKKMHRLGEQGVDFNNSHKTGEF